MENAHRIQLHISTYVNYKKLIRYIVDDLGNVWLDKLAARFTNEKRNQHPNSSHWIGRERKEGKLPGKQ
ncbi:hypothetical protein KSZ_13220 [Dictyobacter formicarum]|uniref:Uncharacterized protein n=1 Tax=Dictyobacter formicarum TaxID=2778368 RepID=A0ABQ3VC73_9CHLR|nr:hypothetical protein KSZ_13220 [Dictyobacter formicarum]